MRLLLAHHLDAALVNPEPEAYQLAARVPWLANSAQLASIP